MRRLTYLLALCLLAVPRAGAHAAPPAEYTIRDLGSVDDRGQTEALAINDRGEIVGWGTSMNNSTTPFYWSERTGFLKIFTDVEGIALDINDRGQVIGWRNENGIIRGFLWSMKDGLVSLGAFFPLAINDRGEIVGQCESGGALACLISDGNLSTLAAPAGGAVEVTGINERGDVGGTVFGSPFGAAAAIWRRQTRTESFTVLEPTSAAGGYNAVVGLDINDRGVVSGALEAGTGETRTPAVWDRTGNVVMNTAISGFAVSVNNHDIAAIQADVPLAALAWDTKRMTVSVLPSLGGTDYPIPRDINNRGQIVGMANHPTAGNHAVMWELEK